MFFFTIGVTTFFFLHSLTVLEICLLRPHKTIGVFTTHLILKFRPVVRLEREYDVCSLSKYFLYCNSSQGQLLLMLPRMQKELLPPPVELLKMPNMKVRPAMNTSTSSARTKSAKRTWREAYLTALAIIVAHMYAEDVRW